MAKRPLGVSSVFGWLSIAAVAAAVAPAVALAVPAVQQKLSSPMSGVGLGYILFAWWMLCCGVGALLGIISLVAATRLKESRTLSLIALALNVAILVYFGMPH